MKKILTKSEKFIADESLGLQVANNLKKLGYDINSIADIARGTKDVDILLIALKEDRILVTTDKDFGYLVFKEKLLTTGVILVRLRLESVANLINLIAHFLSSFNEQLKGKFIVISDERVKIRKILQTI